MNIDGRMHETDSRFEQKKVEREQHLQAAEECAVEMNKLQGEYRLLGELLAEQNSKVSKNNKKANVIETIPEQMEV